MRRHLKGGRQEGSALLRTMGSSLVALILLLMLACAAKTNITSKVNTAELGDSPYTRIFAVTSFYDLELQDAIGIKLKQSLANRGVDCILEHEVFFPGTEPTTDEYLAAFDEHGIEAILIISPMGSGVSNTYVPPTYKTKTTGTATTTYGTTRYKSTSTTKTSGGYSYKKPWATFEAKVFDAYSGEIVWYATGKTGGNAFANFKTVVRSMAGKTVVKLASDGVIP